jgi:SAM-dependent methyltransferase
MKGARMCDAGARRPDRLSFGLGCGSRSVGGDRGRSQPCPKARSAGSDHPGLGRAAQILVKLNPLNARVHVGETKAMASVLNYAKNAAKRGASLVLNLLPQGQRRTVKENFELRYWKNLSRSIAAMDLPQREAALIHERAHYEYFFTKFFDLSLSEYKGKKILDVGCGPMGSLEWADQASVRIGLDPLVKHYLHLGALSHRMEYVVARSENIPYENETFDFVTSFNSLDHVSDVPKTIHEMKRVTVRGGFVLLITEIEHAPTFTEPHSLSCSVTHLFAPQFTTESVRLFGIADDHNLYAGLLENMPYEDGRAGVLSAKMRKR